MDVVHTSPPSNATTFNYDYYYYSNDSLVIIEDDESETFGGVFSGVLYCLIFCLSLVGNGLLLWALLRHENLRKTSTIFLLNLIVSDVLFTMHLPFWAVYQLYHWVFGEAACKVLTGLFFLGLYSYMIFLVALTVDRYTAIVHAMSFWRATRRLRAHLTCAVVWVFCAAASLPDTLSSETKDSQNGTLCVPKQQSLKIELLLLCMQIIVFFLVPFVIIIFCYARIWTRVQKCRTRKKHQAVKLMLGIVIGFFICWAPYNIILVLTSLMQQDYAGLSSPRARESIHYSYYVFHCLAYCHCCINPFVHIFGAGKFRSYFSSVSRRFRSQTFSSQNGISRTSLSSHTTV